LYLSLFFTLVMLLTGLLASPTYAGSLYETVPGNSHIVLFSNAAPRNFQTRVEALGGTVDFTHPVGIAIVSGLSEEAVGELGRLRGVQSVQESGYFAFDPGMLAGDPVSIDLMPASPSDPTTAAGYARQWNMRAIDADDAWAAGYLGSPEVTVAILDTGIDYDYPDLWGRVDLSRSISFIPEDDALVEAYFPGKHPVTDLHFHGTHVAATVASNAYILAGVTSQATLMGVKVCSFDLGYCPGDAIVQGILHAIDNGADVINMSLGGYFYKNEYPGEVAFINKLFTYANRNGVVVVVSAGNAAMDLDHNGNMFNTYCDATNVICVSATGPTYSDSVNGPWYEIDAPAYYTNYGRSAISVAAPGGNSGGWVWAGCSTTSLLIPVCQTGYYVLGAAGTSMAAPHVSGLAAMVVEDVGRNPAQVRNAIKNGADDLGQPGTDPFYGKGRINVYNTVD
jgi:lantibiotic leader peptide-processing serine protease